MSRYDWPAAGGRSRDRQAQRQAWIAARRPLDASVLDDAVAARRALESAPLPRGRSRRTPKDPPAGNAGLWVPIGPAVVLRGQADNEPRVSGRVRALAVHREGLRAYAGTANGGLWYTDDGGGSWLPLGVFAMSRGGETLTRTGAVGAQGLTVGALAVRFADDATGGADDVVVGTGELGAASEGRYGGVGVLHARGPAVTVRADANANPWTREAKNIVGQGVYALARDPDNVEQVAAATSEGLYLRRLPVAMDSEWTPVSAAPFDATSTPEAPLRVTDVAWVKHAGAAGSRLWVAINDRTGGTASGLWVAGVSAAGVVGTFERVQLDGLAARCRLGIATAAAPSRLLYVLGLTGTSGAELPALWRVDDAASGPSADVVERLPPGLFGGPGPGQSRYDLTVAVDPTEPTRVVLGGSTLLGASDYSAALFVCRVQTGGPTGFRLDYTQAAGSETSDPTWRGAHVHADVHAAVFARSTAPADQRDLWIACDGGVYVSHRSGVADSFVARNTGISSLEAGYLAGSPASEVDLVVGTQDNGTIRRVGDSIWSVAFKADGGGAGFDPQRPDRFVRQYTNGEWRDSSGTLLPVVFRGGVTGTDAPDHEQTEDSAAAFYSNAATAVAAGFPLLALGTNRVWVSLDFGTSWVTLPGGVDPRAATPTDTSTDVCVVDASGGPLQAAQVVALRWARPAAAETPLRLVVLCAGAVIVHHVTIDPSTATVRSTASRVHTIADGSKIKNRRSANPIQHHLPVAQAWTDVYPHDAARGTHGSFYVTTTGPANPAQAEPPDTVWWFDGTDTWYSAGLLAAASRPDGAPGTGTKAPAYAVVVDPDDADTVYVGTGAGVWKGTLTDPADPTWDWQVFSNGLPEATVADLEIVEYGTVKLLRAAMHALGVYEVSLAGATTPTTFVRVHDLDSRRAAPTPLTDPRVDPAGTLRWDASPDVRPRMALGAPAPTAPPPNITGTPAGPADRHRLWVFQTALRRIDPLVRCDGQWSADFTRRLAARRTAAGLAGAVRVDQAIWNNVVTAARRYAEPWDDAFPSEADLFELVVDRPPASGDTASLALTHGRAKVDVLVHHRHAVGVDGSTVRVVLLRHELGATPDDGATLSVGWTAKVTQALTSGATPTGGWALADGWSVADAATPLRSPVGLVHPRTPRAVTFDVDLTAPTVARLILVAAVASTADLLPITGADLRNVVLHNRGVAARSVLVV